VYGPCIEWRRDSRPEFHLAPATPGKVDLAGTTGIVIAALRELERELERFVQALAHGSTLVSLDPRFATPHPVETVCEAFSTIDYGIDDDLNASVRCVGVACAARAAVEQGERLNVAKERLQRICAPLQRHRMRIRIRNADGEDVVRMTSVVRVILRQIGRAQLNLRSAYRRVPILGAQPARIAFTRTLTRRVRRLTREALFERLEFSGKPGAAEDRERLRAAPDSHFALADPHIPNVRANVWYQARDARNRDCVQISAELPIIYRCGRSPTLPAISFPDSADWARAADGPRRPRTTKLEPDAFLRTLPVFRYRAPAVYSARGFRRR